MTADRNAESTGRSIRRALAAIGLVLLAFSFWVLFSGEITLSSRGQQTRYVGTEARSLAAMLACFGISKFGGWLGTPGRMIAWMSTFLIIGLGAVLVPVYLSA